jgi:predicted heme/steroid binding protein
MPGIVASSLVLLSSFGNGAFGQQAVAPVAAPSPVVAPTARVVPATVVAPAPVAAVVSLGPDASGRYMLRDGTDVDLQFAEDLSSKTSSEGDPVILTLTEDVKVVGVVAKAGSKAYGEVTKAEKSGMMGKAGELNIRLNYLKVGDEKIKLRGTKGKEGESGVTGTVVLTVLFGPIGLIKHGKNVEIKQGQALHAFVGEDIAVVPAS